ncbi:hypothetical protein DRQ53_09665 [bacterium]|nr:MAG: hypothetical protein DRQ53_09665 [bacterium]
MFRLFALLAATVPLAALVAPVQAIHTPAHASDSWQVVFESEPNNDNGAADPLAMGDEMHAAIGVAGDVDCFRFVAVANQEVLFETHPGDIGWTIMGIFSDDGTQLAVDGLHGDHPYSRIQFVFPSDGTYFVKVAHFAFDGTGTYILAAGAPGVVPLSSTSLGRVKSRFAD